MIGRIARTGLALVTLLFLGFGAGARPVSAASSTPTLSGFGDAIVPVAKPVKPHPFKLKGAGQIDTLTFTLDFSGKASAIGKYSATGQVDPATFDISGVLTASDDHHCADGETINWTATFTTDALGQIVATFNFAGGTGKFANVTGSATGPVVLDPSDYMFTLNLVGTLAY